ncbi:MAG: thioredoxin domain-containing protein [Proteobacteria bacterium]|nr:thioredoxin domain-containing protein [Pseudomonadota bacterium]
MRYLTVPLVLALVAVAAHADEPPTPEDKELAAFVKELEELPTYDVEVHPYDARKGPDDAPVRVIVFSDFKCRPYCAGAAAIADGLIEEHGDLIQVVYKNYPLSSDCNPHISRPMHTQACPAALAAQCAGEQDLFWAFHDALYAQETLDTDSIGKAARRAGLKMGPWRVCQQSERPAEQVRAQADQGKAVELVGTPTWIINGRKMAGSFTYKVDRVVRYEVETRAAATPATSP